MRIERALVCGAGLGGLAAATGLAQRGIDVDVVGVPTHTDGVASNLPSNASRALRDLGLLEHCQRAGVVYDRNTFYDWRGVLLADCPSKLGTGVPPYIALPREDLHRILLDAAESAGAKIDTEARLTDLLDHGDAVEVTFSDGRVQDYDLLAAFEGIHSPLRDHLFGGRGAPAFTGYSAWRTIVERPAEVDHAQFYQGDGSRAGVVPINDRQMCLLHITPEPGNPAHDPARLPESLARRLEGYGGLIGELRDRLDDDQQVVYSPLFDVPLPPSWYLGRVVLLGSTVHGCAPHAIHGSGLSLEDAVVLAEGTEDGLSLPSFMWRRFDRVQLARDSCRAVLFTEIGTSAAHAAERLPRMLPDQLSAVETYLNQPY